MAFQADPNIFNRANQDRRADETLRIQQQQEQRAQQTDSRDAQMDDFKLKNAKIEQAVQYLGMATPENWQNIRQQAIQSGLGDETTLPMEYDDNWIKSTRSAFASASSSVPSAIQEYQFYKNLPADEQAKYIESKRNPYVNLGDRLENPYSGDSLPKGVSPDASPENKGAGAQAVADVELEMKPITEATVKEALIAAEARADAKTRFGKIESDAKTAIDNIDAMIGNAERGISQMEGLTTAVGPLQSRLPTLRKSTADFEARLKQAVGGAFLDSFEQLKGGGAITQIEGEKATQAKTRMSLATSEEEFITAAKEYRDIVATGLERAKQKMQTAAPQRPTLNDSPRGNAPAAAPANAPAAGDTIDWGDF